MTKWAGIEVITDVFHTLLTSIPRQILPSLTPHCSVFTGKETALFKTHQHMPSVKSGRGPTTRTAA